MRPLDETAREPRQTERIKKHNAHSTHARTQAQAQAQAHTNTHARTHTRTHARAHMHTRTHTRNARTHTPRHAHAHSHTHFRGCKASEHGLRGCATAAMHHTRAAVHRSAASHAVRCMLRCAARDGAARPPPKPNPDRINRGGHGRWRCATRSAVTGAVTAT